MVPCKSTAEEVSFEWSHDWNTSADSKVRTTLHVFIIYSGGILVKNKRCFLLLVQSTAINNFIHKFVHLPFS